MVSYPLSDRTYVSTQEQSNLTMSTIHQPPIDRPPRRISILGARVDDITWEEFFARIDHFIRARGPHQIMTPNPEFVMLARHNAAFHTLLAQVDIAPADGVGLRWAARLLGEQLRELVPGSDITFRLAE